MAYERYKILVTKDEFFSTWTIEQLCNLDNKLKDYIYQKHLIKCVVFQRDNFKCQNEKCVAPHSPLTLHHIKFQKNGGEDKPKNCVTICKSCHNQFHKGVGELTFWGMTYKIHKYDEINWKEIKKKSKLIRKANEEFHGYKVSWEMVCQMLTWLRLQEKLDTEEDQGDD